MTATSLPDEQKLQLQFRTSVAAVGLWADARERSEANTIPHEFQIWRDYICYHAYVTARESQHEVGLVESEVMEPHALFCGATAVLVPIVTPSELPRGLCFSPP